MIVYFFVAFLAIIIQFVPVKSNKQYLRRTICSFIPLFLYMALRKDFGFDEYAYHYFFDNVHKASNIFNVNSHMEPGYAVLNKIMPTYQSLIIFTSFLTLCAYSFLIYRFVPRNYSWLAVLILFMSPSLTIFFMISGIRNGISASLLILSCYYLEKRKLKPYIIIGIIAVTIHTSALFMFPVCYLLGTNKPLSKRTLTIGMVVMVVMSFISLSILADNILPIISYVTGKYDEQVMELAEVADNRGVIGALVGIILGAGLIYYLWKNNKNRIIPKNKKQLSSMPIMECDTFKYKFALLYAAAFTLGALGGRISQYLIYYFIIAVVGIMAHEKDTVFKFGYLLIVLYLSYSTMKGWMTSDYFHYDVYKSVFGDF